MDRILEELARHVDDTTRPDVDLYLASGPVLRGRVMKVQQGLATVHLGPAKDPSVSYVRIEQIVAVTVIAGGRSARSLTPSKGIEIGASLEGPRAPSHHDDIITPVNEMSLAAMQAAMATPTPPEELAQRHMSRTDKARADKARGDIANGEAQTRRADDVSAAFSAMRVETGSVPAPDPIAEFVASQYDVITPPDPIEPPSLHFGPSPRQGSAPRQHPVPIEAPTYLGERPQPRAKTPTPSAKVSPAAIAAQAAPAGGETFSMRGETPKPKPARTPAPSRPELMRQANVHGEMMSRVLRHRVDIAIGAPLDDDSRRAIGHALPVASDVLLAMFGEPKHRPVLEKVASVELVAGEAEVVIDNARLIIRCSLVDRWTPASLRAAVEAAT
ncbi:MAG: hypothetical protein AB7T06_03150 [Kofleriaceae bacterium]